METGWTTIRLIDLLNVSGPHPNATVQACAKGAIGLEKLRRSHGTGQG